MTSTYTYNPSEFNNFSNFLNPFLTSTNISFLKNSHKNKPVNPTTVSDTEFIDLNLDEDDIKPTIQEKKPTLLTLSFQKIKKIYENINPVVIDFTIKSKKQIEIIKANSHHLKEYATKENIEKFISKIEEKSQIVKDNTFIQSLKLKVEKTSEKLKTKKFKDILTLLGGEINPNSLIDNNLTSNEVLERLNQDLQKNLGINIESSLKISNELNKLSDSSVIELTEKKILPKLLEKLNNSLNIQKQILEKQHNNDNLKLLEKFAKNNKISSETALDLLKNNHPILNSFTGVDKILKNREKILITNYNFEQLLKNTEIISKELINVIEQNLIVVNTKNPSFFEKFKESYLLTNTGNPKQLKDIIEHFKKLDDASQHYKELDSIIEKNRSISKENVLDKIKQQQSKTQETVTNPKP